MDPRTHHIVTRSAVPSRSIETRTSKISYQNNSHINNFWFHDNSLSTLEVQFDHIISEQAHLLVKFKLCFISFSSSQNADWSGYEHWAHCQTWQCNILLVCSKHSDWIVWRRFPPKWIPLRPTTLASISFWSSFWKFSVSLLSFTAVSVLSFPNRKRSQSVFLCTRSLRHS